MLELESERVEQNGNEQWTEDAFINEFVYTSYIIKAFIISLDGRIAEIYSYIDVHVERIRQRNEKPSIEIEY